MLHFRLQNYLCPILLLYIAYLYVGRYFFYHIFNTQYMGTDPFMLSANFLVELVPCQILLILNAAIFIRVWKKGKHRDATVLGIVLNLIFLTVTAGLLQHSFMVYLSFIALILSNFAILYRWKSYLTNIIFFILALFFIFLTGYLNVTYSIAENVKALQANQTYFVVGDKNSIYGVSSSKSLIIINRDSSGIIDVK